MAVEETHAYDHISLEELDWCGVFALALVRVGRHLEVKAINKAGPPWSTEMVDSAGVGL